jgi:hypothetical protein
MPTNQGGGWRDVYTLTFFEMVDINIPAQMLEDCKGYL